MTAFSFRLKGKLYLLGGVGIGVPGVTGWDKTSLCILIFSSEARVCCKPSRIKTTSKKEALAMIHWASFDDMGSSLMDLLLT